MREIIFVLVLMMSLQSQAQNFLKFSQACSRDEDIEITAVGDVLLHSPLQIQATQSPKRFLSLWDKVTPAIERADFAYANFEGPSAPGLTASGASVADPGFRFDDVVYTSYPQFNYHPFLIEDLKKTGFDIVSTANNHALDRYSAGADRTIENMKRNQMLFTGTRLRSEPQSPFYTITTVKNRRIAWLACTFSTNGIKDTYHQVLPCYENPKALLQMVSDLAKNPNLDAVIVTPHWGVEYEQKPHESQVWLGRQLLEAGATAVIGTHPHVVQTWEKYITKTGREGFIMYSTGNFVSGQELLPRRTSVLIQLHLVSKPGQKLAIRGVEYLPLLMQQGSEGLNVEPIFRFDSSVPSESVAIWNRLYNEKQKIESFNENAVEKICQSSAIEL